MIEIIPSDKLGIDEILQNVKEENPEYLLVIGRKNNGDWYFTSNDTNPMKHISAAQTFLNYVMDM